MKITTLLTGAAVQTVSSQPFADETIMIGDVDTTCPLTGLTVEVDGEATINIQGSTPLVSTFAKLMMQMVGSGVIGLAFSICLGKLKKATTYRFTNAGATTPDIFAYSKALAPVEAPNGGLVRAATKGINALSNDQFDKFSYLAITPSANVATVDLIFEDGNRTPYTVLELDALFAEKNSTEANGRLDSVVTCIDNRDGKIAKVQVNTTTAVTVMVVKLDNADFKALKAAA